MIVATEVGGAHNDLWQVPVAEPSGLARTHVEAQITAGKAFYRKVAAQGR